MRTGNPDLFRARTAGAFPIHGAADDVSHLGKPPTSVGLTVSRHGMAISTELQFMAVDDEFELFVIHI